MSVAHPRLWPRWARPLARLVCRDVGHCLARSLTALFCVRCGHHIKFRKAQR